MKNADTILWNKLRRGDRDAFDEIYYKCVPVLFNFGKRYTRNNQIVEDCIQELFTDLWIKRKKLGGTDQIKPYLLVALKRRVLRQIKKAKNSTNFDQLSDFFLVYSAEDNIILDDSQTTKIDKLNKNLANLTPKQKEVIYLKFYEQLSYTEIAKIMKVEVKAIYKLMARAISNLRSDFI